MYLLTDEQQYASGSNESLGSKTTSGEQTPDNVPVYTSTAKLDISKRHGQSKSKPKGILIGQSKAKPKGRLIG